MSSGVSFKADDLSDDLPVRRGVNGGRLLPCVLLVAASGLTVWSTTGYLEPVVRTPDSRIVSLKDGEPGEQMQVFGQGKTVTAGFAFVGFAVGALAAAYARSQEAYDLQLQQEEADRRERKKAKEAEEEALSLEVRRQKRLMSVELDLKRTAALQEVEIQSDVEVAQALADRHKITKYGRAIGMSDAQIEAYRQAHLEEQAQQQRANEEYERVMRELALQQQRQTVTVPAQPVQPVSSEAIAQPTTTSELIQSVPNSHPVVQGLISALAKLELPAVFQGALLGHSIIQARVKPVDSTMFKKFMESGPWLQLEMGLNFPPTVSIVDGAIAYSIPRVNDRETARFADYISKGYVPGQVKMAIGVDVKRQLHEVEFNSQSLTSYIVGGMPRSGKSKFFRAAIASITYRYKPEQVQLVLMDGKAGAPEFDFMRGSKYLAYPDVPFRPEDAKEAIRWVKDQVEKRFTAFAEVGATHLDAYLAAIQGKSGFPVFGYMPVICDEFQDLFDTSAAARAVSDSDVAVLSTIASLGPGAGVPLLLGTQRPDRNVIPGQIDGKCASRIAFLLQREVDSKLVLSGEAGAEYLMPQGDMLYKAGGGQTMRLQSVFIPDEERFPIREGCAG